MAEYCAIEQYEMIDFLGEMGFCWSDEHHNEITVEKTIRYVERASLSYSVSCKVYTSIDLRTGVSRDAGKDAIRVVLLLRPFAYKHRNLDLKDEYPLMKNKRVHRVANWRKNLELRLEKCSKFRIFHSPMDYPLVLLKGANGYFYGSIAYPEEKFTMSYERINKLNEQRRD